MGKSLKAAFLGMVICLSVAPAVHATPLSPSATSFVNGAGAHTGFGTWSDGAGESVFLSGTSIRVATAPPEFQDLPKNFTDQSSGTLSWVTGNSQVRLIFDYAITDPSTSPLIYLNLGGAWSDPSWVIQSGSGHFDQSFTVTDGSGELFLQAYAGATGDISVSNISLTEATSAPVPEPGTLMLLGAGCFSLAICSKRRKNAR